MSKTEDKFYTQTGYAERLADIYIAIIGGQVSAGIFDVREAKEAAVDAMRGLEQLMMTALK